MSRHQILFKRVAAGPGSPLLINPNTIPGWIAIHDSRSITPQADNTFLAAWPDTSGNGRTAGPAFPGFSGFYRTGSGGAGTPTGQPIVDMVGNRAMLYGLPASGVIDTSQGWTAIVWFDQVSTATPDQPVYWSPIANNFVLLSRSGLAVTPALLVDGATADPTSVTTTTGFHIAEALGLPPRGLAAGGVVQVWWDGVMVGQSASAGWSMNSNTEQHMSRINPGIDHRISWAGYINRVLTPGQRSGIRRWLVKEFGALSP